MINVNPFPVSFGQAVLDSIVTSAGGIFSVATLSVVIPFILKLGIIASVAFAIFSIGFRAFELINSGNLQHGDGVDSFVGGKKEKITYEKGIRGKPLTEKEKTRPKIAKFVDSM